MADMTKPIDVFISRKSADKALANELYHYLSTHGLNVFESDETLPKMGSSDYRKAIDKALDECNHMVVIGSSVENIASSWVEAEWGFYIGEKRAGRKKGNILTVITGNLEIKDLPASLRYYEVIYFEKSNFGRIAAYLGKNYEDPKYKPPRKSFLKSKWFLPVVAAIALLIVFAYIIIERNKPFDATVFVKPSPAIKQSSLYPAFEGGELTLMLDNKEEKKSLLPDGEVVFRQLPASFQGEKVVAKLTASNWKLENDTIELGQAIQLFIVPDQSLAAVYGNIKDEQGNAVSDCRVIIDDNDTTIVSDKNGFFRVDLPYSMQKKQYMLDVRKEGYQPQKISYFAKSGTIDIVLEK